MTHVLYCRHMKRTALLLGFMAVTMMGVGCGTKTAATPDGGVYRTADYGKTWTQPSILNLGAKLGSIANVGTVSASLDAQDPNAMYVGTTQNGLLTTLDGAQSWEQARGLSTGQVTDVAVDPFNKCVVFATRGNQLLKTSSCGRDWDQVYFDPRTAQIFTTVTIDPLQTTTVYAGNNDGDIFRSEDTGASWRVLHRADSGINDLVIDPRNNKTVYVATNGSGTLKTIDRGATWQEIDPKLEQNAGSRRPLKIVLDPTNANTIYHVSRNGLLRSDDMGSSWRALALPTPPESTNVRSFAIHPKNANVLVYATDTSIVFTADGGQTWTPKKLPTTRSTSFLLFDQGPANALFLGTVNRK